MAFSLAQGFVEISEKGFSPVSAAIDRVKAKMTGLASTPMGVLGSALDGISSCLKSMLSPMGLVTEALAALGMGAGISAMIGKAADLEEVRGDFDALTNSVEATDKLLGELKKTFTGTKLAKDDVRAAAKDLLALGVAAEEVPARLRAMGNVAAASNISLEGMAGAMKRAERGPRGVSMAIMSMGGLVQEELMKITGAKGLDQLFQGAQEGAIGVNHLKQAIENLNAGNIGNTLDREQAGMTGQWEILKSTVGSILTDIGGMIVEAFDLKGVTGSLTDFAKRFKAEYGETIRNALRQVAEAGRKAWAWVKSVWDYIGGMKTFKAVIDSLASAWNVFTAVVGTYFEVQKAVFGVLYEVVDAIFGVGTSSKQTYGEMIQDALKWATETLDTVASWIRNWDIAMKLVWEYVKLAFGNAIEPVVVFAKNAGAVFLWLSRSAWGIFQDIGNIIVTTTTNAIKNIKAYWEEFWAWLESGGSKSWAPDTKNLLEGFKSSLTAMPQMASAHAQTTNAVIEKLHREMEAREAARNKKKPGDKSDREQWIGKGAGQAAGMAAGMGGGAKGSQGLTGFIGMTELAERMQTEALKQNMDAEQLGALNDHTKLLGDIADGVQRLGDKPADNQTQHWGA
jgi:hypothetical protein